MRRRLEFGNRVVVVVLRNKNGRDDVSFQQNLTPEDVLYDALVPLCDMHSLQAFYARCSSFDNLTQS